ncbi:MAG: phosphatase PAP2 family protein [Acutalibacteraceae bacterium]|nr:phosphatase PAP2 family protein [Acutalibacteraceae bacterium]
MPFDFPILYFIQDNIVSPILNGIMVFVSAIGEGGAIWVLTSLFMIFFRKTRTCGILMLCAMAFCYVTGDLLAKNLFCRIRPCYQDMSVEMLVNRPNSYSFPSGHSSSSFAAASTAFYFNKKIGIPALFLAGLVAFSRLYLFVHFPSDVITGILWGIFGAILTIFIYKKFFDKNNKKLVRE